MVLNLNTILTCAFGELLPGFGAVEETDKKIKEKDIVGLKYFDHLVTCCNSCMKLAANAIGRAIARFIWISTAC